MEPIIIKHLRGSKSGQTEWFDLELNEELTIGRDPSNRLQFHKDEDDLVGRKHAKIVRQHDQTVLVDLQSRNGTFVNHERITEPTALKSGDVIEFGPGGPSIQFYQGKDSLAGLATRVLQRASTIRPTRFVVPVDATGRLKTSEMTPTDAINHSVAVKHLQGSKTGQTEWHTLGPDDELTIGRDPSNTIAFDQEKDLLAGRKHAKIIRQGDGFVVIDLDSRNGTFVNGQRVTGRSPLKPGDVIEFGVNGPKIRFYQGETLVSDLVPTAQEHVAEVIAAPTEAGDTTFTVRNLLVGTALLAIFIGFITAVMDSMSGASSKLEAGEPGASQTAWALSSYQMLIFFVTTLVVIAVLVGAFASRQDE
ncbi:MAG: FHA domain-containing protein [Acidobacteriota bacterium]|nr:FHA domain-containing protein [Blastocatellia bacterium]MDW8239043.1 FHA domain-containing protein [Acidobacteriota bacterium]